MRKLRYVIAATGGWLLLVAACGQLREDPVAGGADDASSSSGNGGSSGTTPSEGGSGERDAAPDARRDGGTPSLTEDTACADTDVWTSSARRAECEPRKVRRVADPPIDALETQTVDIAWSEVGRVCIVTRWITGPEAGYASAYTFDSSNHGSQVRAESLSAPNEVTVEGNGAKVVATDNAFVVLGQRDEEQTGGDVLLWRLPHSSPFEQPPTTVFTGAVRNSPLSLAVRSDGQLVATAVLPYGSERALRTRLREPNATEFTALSSAISLQFDNAPADSDNHSITFDANDVLHMAYHRGAGMITSQPRYTQFTGEGWIGIRTVDNSPPEGMAGAEPSVFVRGDEKNVVYFAQRRQDGQNLMEAELRRGHWRGSFDAIEHEVLASGLSIEDGLEVGGHAMAKLDAHEAMHVVYSRRQNGDCQVFYLHEGLSQGARTVFRDDLTGPFACSSAPVVALAVEPEGRPHIVYSAAGTGIYYATRFDR